MPKLEKKKVFVTGGGTGGHYFAAESFIKYLREKGYEPIFIGSEFGIENGLVANLGIEYKLLKVLGFSGKNLFSKLKSIFYILNSIFKCLVFTKKHKPIFVIGFGGYTTVAVIISAFITNTKRIIVEQNSVPGLANRILSKISNLIFVNFENTKNFFNKKNIYVVGNPIRITKFLKTRQFDVNHLKIGVIGGSRGAKSINNALFEFAKLMDDKLILQVSIIHQTGKTDYNRAIKIYKDYNINAVVYDFISDMESFYSSIDIIISRSGASALSEIACFGLPSILVPFPYAIYNHQYYNAKTFEECQAAKIILDKDFNGYYLKNFVYYIKETDLASMSHAAFSLCKADVCAKMLNIIEVN